MRRLLRRLRYVIRHSRADSDLAEELRLHHELKRRTLEADGWATDDARLASRRALGNDALVMNQARDVWISPWLQDLSADVRFAVRMLAKDRRFTVAAVVALGLGIGLNNSVFAIIHATLIRDVPFEHPDRLVTIGTVDGNGRDGRVSMLDFRDWQQSNRSFEDLAAHTEAAMNVSDAALAPERLRGTYVSFNTFRLLRVAPVLGRDFSSADDRRDAPSVAIISQGVWLDRYGSDPGVIGRTIKVNDVPTTVIGVMPPGFKFPFISQIWQPLTQTRYMTPGDPRRDMRNLGVVGRLTGEAPRMQAHADLEAIAARLAQDHPNTNKGIRIRLAGLKDGVARTSRPMLMTMMGAVAFVMLIACANLANLLLARSASRSREIAIRASLGAHRWRIVRQLLVECALLAAMAGTLGWGLSYLGVRQIAVAFSPLEIGTAMTAAATPYWLDVTMDGYVYAFIGALCLVATLAFGLLPALHISKTNPHVFLKEGIRAIGGTRMRRWTSALMVAELALTLVLLTGAGLLWRSFVKLYVSDVVMDTSGVMTMELTLPVRKYPTAEHRRRFFERLEDRLGGVPAVTSVTVSSHSPVARGPLRQVAIDGQTPSSSVPPTATQTYVGGRYFETLGLTPIRGRTLTALDAEPRREAAVVNERFATAFFAGQDALGRRIQLTTSTPPTASPWLTIVGVVPTLPRFFGPSPDEPTDPAVYVPMPLDPAPGNASIIVRAGSGGVAAVAPLLREEVRALDADLPLYAVAPLADAIALSRFPVRLVGTWFGILAVIALVVASVGLFALTAHGVAQRTAEIGVRIAIGAQPSQVIWMFVGRTVLQLAVGLAVGLAGALSVGQLLQGYLREISPRDPIAIGIVVVLLATVAALATLLPARRAARIDPAITLRAQ